MTNSANGQDLEPQINSPELNTMRQFMLDRALYCKRRIQVLDLMIVEFSRVRQFYDTSGPTRAVAIQKLQAERVELLIELEIHQKILGENKTAG